ncbi:hypothetical protein E1B28_011934 [Marasmius oreades]|uniref:Uncharacterized protein n=1 Tax=Marasmius oreades TaxID=181124 RepID=A0A9P7UMP3_9AGAR|nr:uncharacterized protein E1B28_011934 [Marasmius oreades]KAG7087887.1 hypothetical protein E1B28_011934 [Marasmius oreades]
MPLESGDYFILAAHTPGHIYPVARMNDAYPQPVLKYNKAVRPEIATWEVKSLSDTNTYYLYNGGKPAACMNNFVWLNETQQVWRIEPASDEGKFIILSEDRKFGWVAPDGEDAIECRDNVEPSLFEIYAADT